MIYEDTESDAEKHREKCGSRDVAIHVQSVTIQPNTDRNIHRERDRQTQIKRCTYTRTMRDNIAEHC